MAEIRLVALTSTGPRVPCDLQAFVRPEAIFGSEKPEVPVLYLLVGADVLRIWPVDPEKIDALGRRLTEIAGARR